MRLFPFFDKSVHDWAIEARLLRWLTFIWLFIGLAMLFSASYAYSDIVNNGDPTRFFKMQLLWGAIGLVAFNVVIHLPLKITFRLVNLGLGIGLVLLFATHISGIGATGNGSTRWLALGESTIQPSELIKPFLVLKAAQLFSQWHQVTTKAKVAWLGVFAMTLAGILLQPNLSMTALCGITLWIIALAANFPTGQLLGTMGLGVMVATLSVSFKDYQRRRVLSFLDPWQSQQGDGFQLTQSLMAIGSGSIWGTGFGMSRQKLFLPFQYTDFIFAIFAEEFGLVGCVLLILMLIVYATLGTLVALKCQNPTIRLVAIGTTFLLVGQSFINIGVATGVLPTTGLPFPFMTYGGSSMISNLFVAGLLIRCGREMSQIVLLRPRVSPELESRKKKRQLSAVK
ncbi:bacterial cell division membrane protein [Synechococcus sp. PCC 7502]|uniref:FtsW/RodA/SpoVE family cell cycle protein n=1 Tax=Synechococcus sp. PCC 7502 TaxID=1173263 RepID=UPI00029FCABC|nr:putative peptidoglycan glycosyltransferase FtsW [Synechococcus sp. PCC 7502]AFY74001.1 bacterial cell division membrane protein [Synechococcus sp. PCC 7502]